MTAVTFGGQGFFHLYRMSGGGSFRWVRTGMVCILCVGLAVGITLLIEHF